jgi:polar amino acid transport system ATP-binding protein
MKRSNPPVRSNMLAGHALCQPLSGVEPPEAVAQPSASPGSGHHAVAPDPVATVLRIEAVDKLFGDRQVLSDVWLRLCQCEVMALCGASGCGKTTLLRIVCGLNEFDRGQLVIDNEAIAAHAAYPRSLYGRIGMTFQEYNLFPHMTAIGNVTLALREVKRLPRREAHERGMAELERMGVASLAGRYPATFSGGERQRVAMARALAMDPLLLLLDEPTAHLDADSVYEVSERVMELADMGTTMLLVTHNIELAQEVADTYALVANRTCCVSSDPAILDALRTRRKYRA